MENYISVLQIDCSTDSAKIQMAIQKAKSEGVNKVVIPKKDTPWIITETISLPDDIEILIDGAHLVLADDTFINMIATENFLKKEKTQQKILYVSKLLYRNFSKYPIPKFPSFYIFYFII